jgi:hypothetical protein
VILWVEVNPKQAPRVYRARPWRHSRLFLQAMQLGFSMRRRG